MNTLIADRGLLTMSTHYMFQFCIARFKLMSLHSFDVLPRATTMSPSFCIYCAHRRSHKLDGFPCPVILGSSMTGPYCCAAACLQTRRCSQSSWPSQRIPSDDSWVVTATAPSSLLLFSMMFSSKFFALCSVLSNF